MRAFLLLTAGGIAGANARFLVSGWAARRYATFPAGTFIINVSGSFLLGLLLSFTAAASHAAQAADIRLLVGTGFCGAYTTFSTFTFETLALARQRDHLPALLNLVGSVLLGVIAGTAGVLLGSSLA